MVRVLPEEVARGLADPSHEAAPTPGLTVIVASREGREVMAGLEDTLVCLAVQDFDDFDVVVPVPVEDRQAVVTMVEQFPPELVSRVTVAEVTARTVAGRLNLVLGRVRAPLTAFVVAGDVVTASWVRAWVEGATAHPGALVRVRSFQRLVTRLGGATLSQTNAVAATAETFDLWRHLGVDQLPLGSFALPTALCHAGLRFDEHARAATWKFGFVAAMLAGVADIGAVTCVHQRLTDDDDPTDDDLGMALERTAASGRPGWAARLQGEHRRVAFLTSELAAARQQADAAKRLHDQVRVARRWRAPGPARRVGAVFRAKRRAGR